MPTPSPTLPVVSGDPNDPIVLISILQLVVTFLGVLASTAVAFVAYRATREATRIARQTREDSLTDGRRRERRDFFEQTKKWIEDTRSDVVDVDVPPEFPYPVDQLAYVIDSVTAHDIADWVHEARLLVNTTGTAGFPDRQSAYETFAHTFAERGAVWVNSHKFDLTPFTLTPSTP